MDRPFGENALALAKDDREAKVVLVQDGVYLETGMLNRAQIKVYAIRQDVQRRGVTLPGYIQIIDYGQFADLIVENKVINFA
ncbi:MAG: DsrH/TusB family sulfur relay protein [Chloroflexi bacterium]|nr:DsrH/TusB family sulfur relay protein [Chloroflexota bacterium]